mgnify:CR=1 FL=1
MLYFVKLPSIGFQPENSLLESMIFVEHLARFQCFCLDLARFQCFCLESRNIPALRLDSRIQQLESRKNLHHVRMTFEIYIKPYNIH